MRHRQFAGPPATPKSLRMQRAIVGAMVRNALTAYAAFGIAIALLARPAFEAFEQGSIITAALTAGGLIGVYALAGGALCVAFVAQLRNWPPPGPNCSIEGGHFVRTWLWAAPRILVQLGLGEHVGVAR
jgi:hypothetical protein